MEINAVVAQLPVSWNINHNLIGVRAVLADTTPGDLVVFPEGMLSGYDGDLTPLATLDAAAVLAAADEVAAVAAERGLYVFCGSLLPGPSGWSNAALVATPGGAAGAYRKVNLAMNERGTLIPGDSLDPIRTPDFVAGVQLCREIRFPEQWAHLARAGAQLFAYLTNAANPAEEPGVWRSHLISRAAENQRYVLSANVASAASHCPSMIVSPRGEVLAEAPPAAETVLRHRIDLAATGDWYLSQRRTDLVP